MSPFLRARFDAYRRLVRLDRPIGIYLLLWPTLWALWLAAEGLPPWHLLAIFVVGTVLMRSAGCAINDFADRHVDGEVERTQGRPLATGEIRPIEAVAMFVVLCLLALLVALPLNRQALWLAVPAAALAASYPFAKRYTDLPQAHLGLAFAWGGPMAFAAVGETIPFHAWVLFLATVFWTVAYDTFYAMVDRDDDLRIGVKSTAILFGARDRYYTALLQSVVMLLLAWVGYLADRGPVFFVALLVAGGFAVYQQWLIRHREREPCFRAFLNNHYFGLVVFAGLVLDYAFPLWMP